jgi:hypothetical protein
LCQPAKWLHPFDKIAYEITLHCPSIRGLRLLRKIVGLVVAEHAFWQIFPLPTDACSDLLAII